MQRASLYGTSMKLSAVERAPSARRIRVQCGGSPTAPAPIHPIVRLTGLASNVMRSVKTAAIEAVRATNEAELNANIKESVRNMRVLALVAPFAAVSGSADTFFIITKAVASFIKLYLLLLFVRVLLSWFPTFTWWEQQPWLALRQVTDPYLKLFSGLVPPLLGTIDLTPLFGFFILQFLAGALDVADDETRFWS